MNGNVEWIHNDSQTETETVRSPGLHESPRHTGGDRYRRLAARLATCGMLLAVAGCSKSDAIQLAPVTGVVFYKDATVKGAYVQFSRKDAPIVAAGFTDDNGKFSLTSYQKDDGAPVGENKVRITLFPPPTDHTKDIEAKRAEIAKIADPMEQRKKLIELGDRTKTKIVKERNENLKSGNKLPKKYESDETSKLSFNVKAGVKNECEFKLTDD